MENKVNSIKAVNCINLFYTQRDKRNSKNKTEFRKMKLRLLTIILIPEFRLY